MKVLIDLEDFKAFLKTLPHYEDEWYAQENWMNGIGFHDYLVWAGKKKAATELHQFLENEL